MKTGIAEEKKKMYRRGFYWHRLYAGAIAVAIVSLSGCGSDRPKTIPIDGRVTINGKEPGEIGKIFFTPTKAAEGYATRPASGSFNAAGHYRVMSWAPDDGLVPGHYTVSVNPADPNKTGIPAKYQLSNSSGLEVDVPADERKVEFDIDVRTK
jgi:hypothetical protein